MVSSGLLFAHYYFSIFHDIGEVLTKFWAWTCSCLRLAHNTGMPDQLDPLTYGLDSDIPADRRWR